VLRLLEHAHFHHHLSSELLENYLLLCHQLSLPLQTLEPTLKWARTLNAPDGSPLVNDQIHSRLSQLFPSR
jgi:hypothetical protein